MPCRGLAGTPEFAVIFGTLAAIRFQREGADLFTHPGVRFTHRQRLSTFHSPVQTERTEGFIHARRADCSSIRGGLTYESRFPKS
jgi:hypothetical protein